MGDRQFLVLASHLRNLGGRVLNGFGFGLGMGTAFRIFQPYSANEHNSRRNSKPNSERLGKE